MRKIRLGSIVTLFLTILFTSTNLKACCWSCDDVAPRSSSGSQQATKASPSKYKQEVDDLVTFPPSRKRQKRTNPAAADISDVQVPKMVITSPEGVNTEVHIGQLRSDKMRRFNDDDSNS